MKGLNSLIVIGLAASVEAARLPLCSAVCLTNAIAATGCKATDTECICSSEVFMSTVAECADDRCTSDHKESTLDTAEQYCSAVGIHGQLKKREAMPEPAPVAEPEPNGGWGGGGWGGFGFFRGGRGQGRPHWGWYGRPKASRPGKGLVTVKEVPWQWVPNFHQSNSQEWWKQQVAQWWRDNGYNWWHANGWHFAPPAPSHPEGSPAPPQPAPWWSHFDESWWQENGGNWWHGPNGNQGNWHGGHPSWPAPPPSNSPEPPPPTSTWTPTHTPTGQPWNDWTITPTPTTTTHTKPTWTPYTTSKPVQTVIPGEWTNW